MPLHIAIAQINPTVGDLPGNARLIVEAARAAQVNVDLRGEEANEKLRRLPVSLDRKSVV